VEFVVVLGVDFEDFDEEVVELECCVGDVCFDLELFVFVCFVVDVD